jgi:lipase
MCGDRKVPEFRFEGRRAAYTTWGEGPPVVFLHPGGSQGKQWEKVVDALGPGWRAIAPDLFGFGGTEPWPMARELTIDLQARLVASVLDDAGLAGPVDVVGHSYGGATALRLTVNRPERVRSLMVIEPIVFNVLKEIGDPLYEDSKAIALAFLASMEKGDRDAAWRGFIDGRNGPGTWARLSDQRRQGFFAQTDQVSAGFISNLANLTTLAECRAIEVPTTVVCGGKSLAADRRIAEVLRDTIPGARYEVLTEAGHMSPLTHPVDVARLVREHLARRSS